MTRRWQRDCSARCRTAHLPRLGDVIAICTGDTVVIDTVNEPIEVSRLVGFHGADTPAETAIPLLVVSG